LLGIAFTGGTMHVLLGPAASIPLLVAPMGASAVLLFAVPAPAVRPEASSMAPAVKHDICILLKHDILILLLHRSG
jgi:CBS-domain-containing membrane protein